MVDNCLHDWWLCLRTSFSMIGVYIYLYIYIYRNLKEFIWIFAESKLVLNLVRRNLSGFLPKVNLSGILSLFVTSKLVRNLFELALKPFFEFVLKESCLLLVLLHQESSETWSSCLETCFYWRCMGLVQNFEICIKEFFVLSSSQCLELCTWNCLLYISRESLVLHLLHLSPWNGLEINFGQESLNCSNYE